MTDHSGSGAVWDSTLAAVTLPSLECALQYFGVRWQRAASLHLQVIVMSTTFASSIAITHVISASAATAFSALDPFATF